MTNQRKRETTLQSTTPTKCDLTHIHVILSNTDIHSVQSVSDDYCEMNSFHVDGEGFQDEQSARE